MLPARAPKRHHQILKPSPLIIVHAGIHQRHHTGQKLMHALLLVEIVDHRRIATCEHFEALLASGIWQAASIKNKSSAISALTFRQPAMKRETENPPHQIVRI